MHHLCVVCCVTLLLYHYTYSFGRLILSVFWKSAVPKNTSTFCAVFSSCCDWWVYTNNQHKQNKGSCAVLLLYRAHQLFYLWHCIEEDCFCFILNYLPFSHHKFFLSIRSLNMLSVKYCFHFCDLVSSIASIVYIHKCTINSIRRMKKSLPN